MSFKNINQGKGVVYLHWLNGITTFSFAILFSSLSLYLTNKIGLSQSQSNGIVGFFLAANFILHFIAGYIGDRLLSNRLLFAISIIIQSFGVMVLNTTNSWVYFGLSLFLIGCGLGSTCINCLITQQFEVHEEQIREKAFFYNYSAMNIGFFSGYILSGFIDITDNYGRLFEFSNFINIITVLLIMKSWRYLSEKSVENKQNVGHKKIGILCIILIIPILVVGFYHCSVANYLILFIGSSALIYVAFLGYRLKNIIEKGRVYCFMFLTLASIIFWMLYFVGPMGFSQFLKYNASLYVGSYYIPPQWVMNLNSIFVVIGSPMMFKLLDRLRNNNLTVSISRQFVFSLLFIALSYLILAIGVIESSNAGLTNMNWIIAHYFFQAIGELLIAPVGFAMIGHLAPPNLQGLMMGIWMMASGIAATLSQYFSNLMTISGSTNPLISNEYYIDGFSQLGLYALLAAFILWLFSKNIENRINKPTINIIEGVA